jgi:hypothetical protein
LVEHDGNPDDNGFAGGLSPCTGEQGRHRLEPSHQPRPIPSAILSAPSRWVASRTSARSMSSWATTASQPQ